MTQETSIESSRAGEARPQPSRGLRALLTSAVQSSRGEEKGSAAMLEATQEVARTARRLEAQLQELSTLSRQGPPHIETGPLVFLLNELATMIDELQRLLGGQQLQQTTTALSERIRELTAITSRNAEVVKRVTIVRASLVLMMFLAGLAGGAMALFLQRWLR